MSSASNKIQKKRRDQHENEAFNELTAISGYKLRQNVRVYKVKWSTQDVALKQLDIAGAQMTPECKEAVEKCIKVIYK
jgi:hypothetical protein